MKNRRITLSLAIMTIATCLATATATVAWFHAGTEIEFGGEYTDLYTGAEVMPYGGGDGTEEHPFEISNRRHLYNLAWIQYIGRYNKYSIKQLYFKVTEPIDMTGITLPPIGTEQYPFLGNFDGGGNAISNLTISNDNPFNENSDFGVTKPNSGAITQGGATTQPNVVGFFGVVGALPNDTTTQYTSSIVAFKNTVLKNLTVKSKTSETLIGLAAGYANGTLEGVKISGNATLDVNNQTSSAITSITNNLSDYGLVGYTPNLDNTGTYTQTLSEFYDSGAVTPEDPEDEWGGSIDFKEFNTRFYNHRNDFSFSTNKKLAKYSTDYTKSSLAYGSNLSTSILNKDPTTNTGKIVYNLQGSGSHTISGDTYTLDGTAMPISIGNNGETSAKNTGYIVSSSRTTSGSANGSVRTASYRNGYLNNSLTDTAKTPREVYTAGSNNGELLTYDRTKTEILTNKNKSYNADGSGSDNFALIKDDMDGYNAGHTVSNSYLTSYTKSDATVPGETGLNLKKYNTSRKALDGLLDSSVTKKVQGIHFMNATIAANQTETLPTVKINGSTYTNSSYPLLKNCIDFNTKTNGIINFFAGAYYDQKVNNDYVARADCFFSLYSVDRNPTTHAINSVKLISKIYKDTRSNNRYIYQYSDNSYSDSTDYLGALEFDMQYLWSEPPVQNALYYFEIPVDAGEFALGGVSGQDGGAYLLYLDLSANASVDDSDVITAYSITTSSSGCAYPIGVDFAVTGVGIGGGNSFGVAIASSSKGTVVFNVADNGSTVAVSPVQGTTQVGAYSYAGTGFGTAFTVTGISGTPPGASTSQRVLTIGATLVSGDVYKVLIIDTLNDQGGITGTQYLLGAGTDTPTSSTLPEIQETVSVLDSETIAELRELTAVVTLTRISGGGEFTTTYDVPNCSYSDKIIDVDLEYNGCKISVGTIATDYHFLVGGNEKTSGSTLQP